jgi:hypothetical protein
VSFAFLVAGFFATTNAGRVALARRDHAPPPRAVAIALLAAFALAAVAAALADDLLDALDISPESFRIASGLVLGTTAARTIVRPGVSGPFAAVLVTPELTTLAISFGADESTGRVLGAAAIALAFVAVTSAPRDRIPWALVAQFLAALQIVVAVALAVSGVQDV